MWFSFLIIILINWCSLATWESSLSHNLILCYRLKRNCCFKNCSLLVAILTIRVYGKVDLVTITFLPIDLYIHICIVCFIWISVIQYLIHHFPIDHDASCFPISPGYYGRPKTNRRQWLCKILGGKQGALWPIWKWGIW